MPFDWLIEQEIETAAKQIEEMRRRRQQVEPQEAALKEYLTKVTYSLMHISKADPFPSALHFVTQAFNAGWEAANKQKETK
jgi:hypothetical protein